MVSPDERYSRQILLPTLGGGGQARIRAARVVVMGCGGLGSNAAAMLARAGVGGLRLVDRDVVELSNLHRQALYDEADVVQALPKAVAAARHLAAINSEVEVEAIVADATPESIRKLIADADVVVDGFDNFEGRYLLNDACVERRVPWIYGACVETSGVVAALVPGRTPCLRCLFPQPPAAGSSPTCDTAGIIGPAANAAAAFQVAQALRVLTGELPDAAVLVSFDVWSGSSERIEVARAALVGPCPCCDKRHFEFLAASTAGASVLCGRDAVMVRPFASGRPDLAAIADRLCGFGSIVANEFLVRATVTGGEVTVFTDGRVLVKGTADPAVARSLVSRFVGV